jgi:hypothetical protein
MVAPKQGMDMDELVDKAPQVKVIMVETPMERPRVELSLRRPHPHVVGLLSFRGIVAGTLEMLPGLRFFEFAFGPVPTYLQPALPFQLKELWAQGLDLEALTKLKHLTFLRTVLTSASASQCKSLANLSELRILRLDCVKKLRGVEILGRLPHLEELTINRVEPFDLAALSSCRSLRRLHLNGHEIDLAAARAGRPQQEEPIEPITVSQTEDGRWTLYQDLSASLDCDDNHKVEALVKAQLRRTDEAAAKRVTFDSEADAFCVYALSRDDVDKVVAAVEALRAQWGHRR